MTRNWEIIREILFKLETTTTANTNLDANCFVGFVEQEVAYNMRLLSDAGFIEAKIMNSSSGDGKINAALATRLTNSGHDLLDTMRNDSVWSKVKEKFVTNGIDMTFELVISVGKKIMEAMLS